MVENSYNPLFVFLFVTIYFFILLWVDRVFSFLFSNTPSSLYFTQMTKQYLFIALACHKCKSHNFTERKSLYRHYVKKEKITLPSPPKGNPRYSLRLGVEITKVKENATIIKYACPSCNNLLKDLDQLVEHIDAVHINERFTDNTEKM